MNLYDRVGMVYGRLTVIRRIDNDKWGNSVWECRCECGNLKIVNSLSLTQGKVKSCGCLKSDSKKRELNPMWISGETMVAGYKQIKLQEHPHSNNQGYVFKHILVMEKILGRFLVEGETIHHINGKRDDNRPENLRLFKSNGEHTAYHHKIGSFRHTEMAREVRV
jgi:uncharacterized protein (DUF1330 family)